MTHQISMSQADADIVTTRQHMQQLTVQQHMLDPERRLWVIYCNHGSLWFTMVFFTTESMFPMCMVKYVR